MAAMRYPALSASILLAGCAIHPLPEDVTGVDTAGIVKQIRCETRNAARTFILAELRRLAQDLEGDPGDPIAKKLLADYEAYPEDMNNFSPNLFPGPKYPRVRDYFNVVYSAAVAYSFDLTMTEDNNLGASPNFLGPWTATFTLGLTGNANRSRQNQRTFTITDQFSFLLTALNTPKGGGQQYCDGHVALGPNYIYPIVGRIGVDEMVRTFFQLNFFENLAAGKDKDTPAMGDNLTFTTTVDLTAMPKVVFAPVATGFQITDASLTGVARRTDTHKVTVGLALEPKGTVALTSLRGFVFSGQGVGTRVAGAGRSGESQVVVLNRVTATATSRAAQIAVQTVDQIKSREVQLIPPPP